MKDCAEKNTIVRRPMAAESIVVEQNPIISNPGFSQIYKVEQGPPVSDKYQSYPP